MKGRGKVGANSGKREGISENNFSTKNISKNPISVHFELLNVLCSDPRNSSNLRNLLIGRVLRILGIRALDFL